MTLSEDMAVTLIPEGWPLNGAVWRVEISHAAAARPLPQPRINSNVAAPRHAEEGVHDMPQLVAVVAEHQRMRRARQHDKLPVRVRQ
jgi:hypothetical protein